MSVWVRFLPPLQINLNIMAKVRVIASAMRYGTNGFKHAGDEFNLPDLEAKEREEKGFVKIIPDNKVDLSKTATKELKEVISTKE